MDQKLPAGWKRVEDEAGLVYYLTRAPEVKITKRCQLETYHRKGRYLEMELSDLDFGKKRRMKKFSYQNTIKIVDDGGEDSKRQKLQNSVIIDGDVIIHEDALDIQKTESFSDDMVTTEEEPAVSADIDENIGYDMFEEKDDAIEEMEVNDIKPPLKTKMEEKREAFLEHEQRKLEKAVEKLTLNKNNTVEHKVALDEAAKNLSNIRKSIGNLQSESFDIESLKVKLGAAKTAEELVQIIDSNCSFHHMISRIEHAKLLEQLLMISSNPDNPIKDFPMDINRNHYSDIINFAAVHAPDVLRLVVQLATRNEEPVTVTDVVRCAYLFSSLSCSVSRVNNGLKKIKSVSCKNNGLTNTGLDALANIGVFETSRTYRNDRDFLASLNEQILRSYAKISVPQITFDNMDLTISNVMHHMTLPYLEFETVDTSSLPMDEKTFDEALDFFEPATVLITSDFNKDLFEHYQAVTAWTLAKLFAEVPRFSWFLKVFPKHYEHPNSESSSRRSMIFAQKPLNYSENNNQEMIKIMEHLQWLYLNLVGEQSDAKDVYFRDLKIIYDADVNKDERDQAEARIKDRDQ